jgi:hypothetical protein
MNTDYILVGVVAVAIGLMLAGVAWFQIVPYQQDRSNAETVSAQVISAEVTSGMNAEGQTEYAPEVTYRYSYEGSEYTSNSVFPGAGDVVSSRTRAEEIVDRYGTDDSVTAYVNTENPESAFLIDQSAPLWYWAGPVLGVLIVLYGINSIRQGLRGVESSTEF